MVVGSALQTTRGTVLRTLVAFAAIKWALYTAWMIRHDDFIWVVVDTGIALAHRGRALPLALQRLDARRCGDLNSRRARRRRAGSALHEHFNHNDLYHVIQIAAMLAFYRGTKRTLSARASMLCRGGASGGVAGSSNEVCGVKRARPSFSES